MSAESMALAAQRLGNAELALANAVGSLEAAQRELSVIVGLSRNHAGIGALREKIKTEMYALERLRQAGKCDLDTTMQVMLEKQAALKNKPTGKKRATRGR